MYILLLVKTCGWNRKENEWVSLVYVRFFTRLCLWGNSYLSNAIFPWNASFTVYHNVVCLFDVMLLNTHTGLLLIIIHYLFTSKSNKNQFVFVWLSYGWILQNEIWKQKHLSWTFHFSFHFVNRFPYWMPVVKHGCTVYNIH